MFFNSIIYKLDIYKILFLLAVKQEQARNQPLLADPRFTAGPTPYGKYALQHNFDSFITN